MLISCSSILIIRVVPLRVETCTLASLLPGLDLAPSPLALSLQFIIRSTEFSNCLLCEKLLQGPFLNILRLVFLELGDELDGALEDGAFVLLATWDNLGQLINPFVDGLSAAALNWGVR